MKPKQQTPTATLFDQISSYWTEIAQADHTENQLHFVKTHIEPKGWILDLACGSGRHTVNLSIADYRMVGLDMSLNLLQIAKRKASEAGVRAPLVRADMRFLPFHSGVFAAVVSLDASFGYLPTEKEDLLSLKEVCRTLQNGGVLLLDVFNRERLARRYRKRFGFDLSSLYRLLPKFPQLASLFRWKEYPSFYLLQKREVTDDEEKLLDVWVFRDKKTHKISVAVHVARLYRLVPLRALLKEAGLQVVHVKGGYEKQTYSEEAKRLIVMAQKPKNF